MKTLEKQSKASIKTKSAQSKRIGSKRTQTSKSTEVLDVDLLKHLQIVMHEESNALQDRQTRIFTWSSSIFLFVIGGLLVVDRPLHPMWANQGILATSIASAALLIIAMVFIRWHQRVQNVQVEIVETQNKIEKLLHCYDEDYYRSLDDYSLYPKRWSKRKNSYQRVGFGKPAFSINFVTVTALLGILAVVMLWVS